MLKNNKTFLTIVNMASSIVWGGIGCFVVTIMVASWFRGNRTWDYWEILLLLGGIQLILSAILMKNNCLVNTKHKVIHSATVYHLVLSVKVIRMEF